MKDNRLNQLLEYVVRSRSMSHAELSALLNVSEDTVRRDIKILSDKGLLSAVRGGAVSHTPLPHHFRAREKHDLDKKRTIAAKAVEFIQDGQVLFLDGGTSVQILAELIPHQRKITVVTQSFPVVSVLEDHPNAEVIFAGGRLSKEAFTTVGHETVQAFKNFRADLCFFGVCSIHPTLGLTTVNHEEAQVKRTMIEMAKKNVALSTLEKLDTAESFYISPISQLDVIVTDMDPEDPSLYIYKDFGIDIR